MSATEKCDPSSLGQPIQFVRGVGTRRAERLKKLGLRTAADLLFFFPTRYQDFTEPTSISELCEGQQANVIAEVVDVSQTTIQGRHILNVLLAQSPQLHLRGVWFNQPYLANKFGVGQFVQFRGRVSKWRSRLQMNHPSVTWIDSPDELPDAELVPVYRLTEGINQREMRIIVGNAIEDYAHLVQESFPDDLRNEAGVCDILTAIRSIHRPADEACLSEARHRLVCQELLILQLGLAIRRHRIQSRETAPVIPLNPKIRARIENRLPFRLTEDQALAFEQISQDMALNYPMNRLLHGEVGSGKTLVAISAMLLAVAAGYQAVLMAPTAILAEQHYRTLNSMLGSSQVKLELWTGSQGSAERRQAAARIRSGETNMVIGTSALTLSPPPFHRLGLVVIDEQHKFGVRQRAILREAGFDPHYLVMTATPIPRTVAMTLFGDLDVSVLRRRTDTKVPVHTYLGGPDNREQWWRFFCQKLRQGRQGYVVAPLVKGDEASAVQSAERLYEALVNGPLEAFRVGLVHGQNTTAEKLHAMREFESGRTQVLVATGLIEVGIDVPNATVMTIESAERFGLSQLHQLRGRVGRGIHPGYVCVFATDDHSEAIERLKAFEEISDGFDLAEADLRLRGPGNLFSVEQTGFPPLMIADLARDETILQQTRSMAQRLVSADPDLAAPSMQRMRQLVLARYGKALELSDVG